MVKRKSIGEVVEEPPRRSTRQRASAAAAPPPASASTKKKPPKGKSEPAGADTPTKKTKNSVSDATDKTETPKKRQRTSKDAKPTQQNAQDGESKHATVKPEGGTTDEGRQYWLMKAEPETRLSEGGVDLKFSIDDLAAKTEPEPWDGIRAYAARNNLRAMKKGDLAFFYHSNCKEPGVVGTMEIVQEHSPDFTAHDPSAPYYDPKDKPSDPRWSVVHVEFRSKFDVPVGLKELRTLCAPGKPLENMQMLKQSRLSVSRVSADEWRYINELAEKKALEAKN